MADSRFFIKKEGVSLGEIKILLRLEPAFSLNDSMPINDVCSMEELGTGCLSFIKHKKFLNILEGSESTAFIVHENLQAFLKPRANILLSKNPEVDFTKVARYIYPAPFLRIEYAKDNAISPKAHIGQNVKIAPGVVIGEGAEIGDNTIIGPNAVIGSHVVIGSNCEIHAGASIMCALLGNGVVVHQNAAIGQAGFGFAITETGILDMPQVGRVIIGDDVHIGAGCAIDRGGLKDTVIGAHTRLDNLVQIGHNVRIGRGCVFVAQSGVAGSTEIGDFSVIGGQVGIADNLKIGKHVKIASKSGVMKDIEDGAIVGGIPSVPIKQWHRQTIALANLTRKE